MRSPRLLVAAALAALLVATLATVQSSSAAFSASTTNSGSSVAAGTVVIGDNDAGALAFDTTAMRPGNTKTTCVRVDYSGTLTAEVRLYAAASSGSLGSWLDLVIDRGTGTGSTAFNDCTGFTATATAWSAGTVSAFTTTATAYGSGVGAYSAASGTSQWFRVRITLQDVNAAQGQTQAFTIAWQARSAASGASFSATTSSATATVPADQLQPPTSVTAAHKCVLGVRWIEVNWTATATTWGTQYRLYRSVNGGSWTDRGTITMGTNTKDDGSIFGSTSYVYRLRTERTGWTWVSANSASSNTVNTPSLCL